MTDRARVYLHQDQVDQLVRAYEGAGRRRLAVAAHGVVFDHGEVYHVYTDPPRTQFGGRHCGAEIVVGADPHETPAGTGVQVTVLLSVVGGMPLARAFASGPDGMGPDGMGPDGTAPGTTAPGGVGPGSTAPGGVGECPVELVPVHADLRARSRSLLETDALAARSVAVVGLGSGGSTIAVHLAQAGVGRMVLMDRDRLEIGNVTRHACGIGDVGRRKTAAVRDLLIGKNPHLDVRTVDADVLGDRKVLERALDGVDLLVAATDTDSSRFQLNEVAHDLGITGLYGRVLSRACGGEVLRVRPGRSACLACVYTDRFLATRPREYSDLAEARRDAPAYASEADVAATVQVGLASDIAPVANMIVKLALVELTRDVPGAAGLAGLDDDLTADFYVWANRRELVYRTWSVMGSTFTTPSILRWYGASHPRLATCLVCGPTVRGTTVAGAGRAGGRADESIFVAG